MVKNLKIAKKWSKNKNGQKIKNGQKSKELKIEKYSTIKMI